MDEESDRKRRVFEHVEAFRKEHHKIHRHNQWSGTCACGRWSGYLNRYGETSYAVHLAEEIYLDTLR